MSRVYFTILLALLCTAVVAKVLPTEPSSDSKWPVSSSQTIQFDIDNDDDKQSWNKFSIDLMTGPDLYTVRTTWIFISMLTIEGICWQSS